METDSRRWATGFSLLELILVIIVISILSVITIKRFSETGAEAQRVAVGVMAGNLAAAVAIVHGQWLALDIKRAQQNLQGFGRNDVDMGVGGWPTGRDGNTGLAMTTKTCAEIWSSLLQGIVPSVSSGTTKSKSDYEVQTVKDLHKGGEEDCLYIYRVAPQHRIRYDADRGEVSL